MSRDFRLVWRSSVSARLTTSAVTRSAVPSGGHLANGTDGRRSRVGATLHRAQPERGGGTAGMSVVDDTGGSCRDVPTCAAAAARWHQSAAERPPSAGRYSGLQSDFCADMGLTRRRQAACQSCSPDFICQ